VLSADTEVVDEVEMHSSTKNAYFAIRRGPKGTHTYFQAENVREKEEWTAHLRACVRMRPRDRTTTHSRALALERAGGADADASGRVDAFSLVQCGWLWKRARSDTALKGALGAMGGSAGGLNWRRRFFVLDGNTLTYTKEQHDDKPSGTYVLTPECSVYRTIMGGAERSHTFEVVTQQGRYSSVLHLSCDSLEEEAMWFAAIDSHIRHAPPAEMDQLDELARVALVSRLPKTYSVRYTFEGPVRESGDGVDGAFERVGPESEAVKTAKERERMVAQKEKAKEGGEGGGGGEAKRASKAQRSSIFAGAGGAAAEERMAGLADTHTAEELQQAASRARTCDCCAGRPDADADVQMCSAPQTAR
jgi:hypothetical protein